MFFLLLVIHMSSNLFAHLYYASCWSWIVFVTDCWIFRTGFQLTVDGQLGSRPAQYSSHRLSVRLPGKLSKFHFIINCWSIWWIAINLIHTHYLAECCSCGDNEFRGRFTKNQVRSSCFQVYYSICMESRQWKKTICCKGWALGYWKLLLALIWHC